MKRLLLTTMCLFAICFSYAQTNETSIEQHLKFKGIPIDGTPSEFGAKLKANGFIYDETLDGNSWYKGSFAGYNNCDVVVKSTNNLVHEVVVLFPKDYSWNQLNNTYSSLKKMLTTKYGNPESIEKFENTPSYVNIEDDNDKYREVGFNRCVYSSLFRSLVDGLGIIILEIKSACRVGLHYHDYYNKIKKESAAINDL